MGSLLKKHLVLMKRGQPLLMQIETMSIMSRCISKKNALIQLLNIAGTGPIFGPIMGALFGPVAFLWIVLGSIFAGGVHDYLTGMISIRNRGAHIPELAGKFLGNVAKH